MSCRKTLHAAAAKGDIKCLVEMLKRGADSNARDRYGMTPLHYVPKSCEISRTLDKLYNILGDKFYDIYNKSYVNCIDLAKVLLEHGADPNAKDEWGVTPLHLAAYDGYRDLVKLLLDHGADPNAVDNFGSTPLHAALERGRHADADIVKLLLERGADPTIPDRYGRTPIDIAMRLGRRDIVQILTSYAQSTRRRSRRRKANPA